MASGLIAPYLEEGRAPYTYEEQKKNLEALRKERTNTEEKLKKLEQEEKGSAILNNYAIKWKKDAESTLSKLEMNLRSMEKSTGTACMCGCLPNCCDRLAAKEWIQDEFDKVEKLNKSYRLGVKGFRLSDNNIVLETRDGDIQNIWDYISKGDGFKVVCIYGIPGVGKTAVAEAVHNKALRDKHEIFSYVMFVKAHYGITLENLQQKIMRDLSIDAADTVDSNVRARKIHNELVGRKKCLIIIDFLWEDFTLGDIGIPDDQCQGDGEAIKVILTSRSRLRCPRIHKNKYFEIKPLTDSWTCYEKYHGPTFSETEGEAKELVKKAVEGCDGLPEAITELAHNVRGMIGQSSSEIASSLKEMLSSRTLSEPSTDVKFKVLECSYTKLNSTAQQCFLYCALYPKGFPIKVGQLIDNWIWEGLLDTDIRSFEEKRNRGRNVLTDLKIARLLESVDSNGGEEAIKMLKLLHDMAVNILCALQLGVYINSGNYLTDFPPIDDPNGNIKRASFMYNELGLLQKQPNCPKLSTLLLQNNPINLINDNFFTGVPNLKLLDLSYTKIPKLPSSISNLKFLQVLHLHHCPYLTTLPCLSTLEELIVLNLFGTPLKELPLGMERLKNLMRLDLSYTNLTNFPTGLVRKLESLQELLLLRNHAEAYIWRSKQSRPNIREAYVEELSHLEGLKVLQLNFFSKEVLYKYLEAIQRMMTGLQVTRFKFCVGGFNTEGNLGENSIAFIDEYPVNHEIPFEITELYLNACRCSSSTLSTLENTGIDFQKLKVLNMYGCSSLTYLFSLKMLQWLQNLERVHVSQCQSIIGIIDPASVSATDSHAVSSFRLRKLQELVLIGLPKLESIYPGKIKLDWPAFCRFSIRDCNKLTMLPSFLIRNDSERVIKVRGQSFKYCRRYYEHEEADIPEENVSFVSVVTHRVILQTPAGTATTLRSDGNSAQGGMLKMLKRNIPSRHIASNMLKTVQSLIGVSTHNFVGSAPLREAL